MKYYAITAIVLGLFDPSNGDALHPRRPETEEAFLKLGHHEKASDEKTMEEKIRIIKSRRHWEPFDVSSSFVQNILSKSSYSNRPNVLLLLADDLGYGDLSVPPFWTPPDDRWPCSEGGVLTPHLERMAANGMVLTNFHSASPVCSPSRVAVMTSLYPWRLDAMNAFELGRDMSQRNGFLPQVPTLVEVLRESGYFTGHSGKWHLGGMREEMRTDRVYKDQCAYGSPNQHGFEEYVSELDGPESPRYTFLNRNSILHSKGHRHLLKDDVPMPIVEKPHGEPTVLSDREAEEAIRMMRHVLDRNKEAALVFGNNSAAARTTRQPFFIQVWFNAPHGPWEILQSGLDEYNRNHSKTNAHWLGMRCPHDGNEALKDRMSFKYKTMITAMDRSIGKLLDALKELRIEDDTIVVFTSDNGPEMGAGTSGPYREGKRSLLVTMSTYSTRLCLFYSFAFFRTYIPIHFYSYLWHFKNCFICTIGGWNPRAQHLAVAGQDSARQPLGPVECDHGSHAHLPGRGRCDEAGLDEDRRHLATTCDTELKFDEQQASPPPRTRALEGCAAEARD